MPSSWLRPRTLCLAGVLALALHSASVRAAEDPVYELTDADFEATTAEGTWILEFYAPWCGHCKRLEGPFREAATRFFGTVKFAKIDGTANEKLKNRFNVNGFPALKIRRPGVGFVDYAGPRTLDGLVDTAKRLTRPTVAEVATVAELEALVAQEGIVFAVGSDAAGAALGEAFGEVAKKWSHEQTFVRVTGAALGTLTKLEHGVGRQAYLGLHSLPAVESWVRGERFPLLTSINTSNFAALANAGRMVAIGVVDPGATERTAAFLDALKRLGSATSSPLHESTRSRFYFASLDGVQWAEFAQRYNISPEQLPRMLVLDAPRKVFFEDASVDEIEEIETFLDDIAKGRHPAQGEGLMKYPRALLNFVTLHPQGIVVAIAAGGLLVVFLVVVFYWCCCAATDEEAKESGRARRRTKGADASPSPSPTVVASSSRGPKTTTKAPDADATSPRAELRSAAAASADADDPVDPVDAVKDVLEAAEGDDDATEEGGDAPRKSGGLRRRRE